MKSICRKVSFLFAPFSIAFICCFLLNFRDTSNVAICERNKNVSVFSGRGIPSVCEPGMRLSTVLKRIGRYVKYHDSSDCYVKYEWGLDISVKADRFCVQVDTMVFMVQPVERGVFHAFDLCYRPDFSNETSMFRGNLDGIVDFSSGAIPVEEIIRKYGECQITFRQGEAWKSLEGVDSFRVEGTNGDVICLNYKSRGVSFTFMDRLVQSIVVFRPW